MPNEAMHVTAARLRFLLNVKGYGGATARDGRRYAASNKLLVSHKFSGVYEGGRAPRGQSSGPQGRGPHRSPSGRTGAELLAESPWARDCENPAGVLEPRRS